jgi:pSer/pThr/pTyr-binding forkhead associated (FHA) protein
LVDKTEKKTPDFSIFDRLKNGDDEQRTRLWQRDNIAEEKLLPQDIRPFFRILKGPESNNDILVRETPAFVGRDPLAAISIPSPTVSRQHAVVLYQNHRFHIKDLGSTNGTLVNSAKITESPIKNGDIIQFGDVVCQFIVEPYVKK